MGEQVKAHSLIEGAVEASVNLPSSLDLLLPRFAQRFCIHHSFSMPLWMAGIHLTTP